MVPPPGAVAEFGHQRCRGRASSSTSSPTCAPTATTGSRPLPTTCSPSAPPGLRRAGPALGRSLRWRARMRSAAMPRRPTTACPRRSPGQHRLPHHARRLPGRPRPSSKSSPTAGRNRARLREERRPSIEATDLAGNPVPIEGCGALEFEPTIESGPTTNLTDSPSGLDFTCTSPRTPTSARAPPAAAQRRRRHLPRGDDGQPLPGRGPRCLHESSRSASKKKVRERLLLHTAPQSCPPAAKIGTLEVSSPPLVRQRRRPRSRRRPRKRRTDARTAARLRSTSPSPSPIPSARWSPSTW